MEGRRRLTTALEKKNWLVLADRGVVPLGGGGGISSRNFEEKCRGRAQVLGRLYTRQGRTVQGVATDVPAAGENLWVAKERWSPTARLFEGLYLRIWGGKSAVRQRKKKLRADGKATPGSWLTR